MAKKSKNEVKPKEEIIELTKEEKERFVEDLVLTGGTTYEKTVFNDKLKLKFRTLSGNEQLEIEQELTNPDSSTAYILHNYSLHLISYSLLTYGDKDISKMNAKERLEFVKALSNPMIDILIGTYNEFQKKIQACTKGEVLDEVFFTTPSIDSEPN